MNRWGNLSADIYIGKGRIDQRESRIIYSTLENLEITQASRTDLPPNVVKIPSYAEISTLGTPQATSDLYIYANVLTIHGEIRVPGGDIRIFARKVIVPEGTTAVLNNTPASLPESIENHPLPAEGTPGADGSSPGLNDAQPGTDNNGQIQLVAGALECDWLSQNKYTQASDGAYLKEVKLAPFSTGATLEESRQSAEKMGARLATPEEARRAWDTGQSVLNKVTELFARQDIPAYVMLADGSLCVPRQKDLVREGKTIFSRGLNFVPPGHGQESGGYLFVDLDSDLPPSLVLRAQGGKGEPGSPGQNGAAGQRGKDLVSYELGGSDAKLVEGHRPSGYTGPLRFVGDPMDEGRDRQFPDRYKSAIEYFKVSGRGLVTEADRARGGGDGGKGGDGGRGGDGGAGGNIDFALPLNAGHAVECDARGGAHGRDGVPGAGGAKGVGGVWTKYTFRILKAYSKWAHLVRVDKDNVGDGREGSSGQSPDRKQWPGVGESMEPTRSELTQTSLGEAFDSAFLQKMLMRAKNLYLMEQPAPQEPATGAGSMGDPAADVPGILGWLVTVLAALPPPNPPLTSADASEQEAYNEDARKQDVLRQACALLRNYSHGLNFFGKTPDWVPRLALKSYTDRAKALLGPLQKIEEVFKTELQKAKDVTNLDLSLSKMSQNLEEVQDRYTDQMGELRDALGRTVKPIEKASEALNAIRDDLKEVFREYELDIKNYVTCEFSFEGLFKALEMVLFMMPGEGAPGEGGAGGATKLLKAAGPMAVLQGAEFIYDMVKSLDEINGVKKSHIIQELVYLDGRLKDSLERESAQRLAVGSDGTIAFRGDVTVLLVTRLEEFEDEMTQFEEAFRDGGRALQSAISDLKDTIKQRSDALMAYNAIITQGLQLRARMSELDAKRKEFEDKAYAASDPTRAGAVSFAASVYQDLRNQGAELVYLAERAMTYWSAGTDGLKSGLDRFRQNKLWLDGDMPTDFTATRLLDSVVNMEDEIRRVAEKRGRPTRHPQPNELVRSTHSIKIDDPAQLQVFRDKRKLFFNTVASREDKKRARYVVMRTGEYRNIRVMYCRPRLEGVPDGSGMSVMMHITHLGSEQLLNRDDKLVGFVHDPVHADFIYLADAEPGREFNSGEDGGFYNVRADDALQEYFSLPGLLARWQIDLGADRGEEDNPGIDLSKLSAITVEFGISFDGANER